MAKDGSGQGTKNLGSVDGKKTFTETPACFAVGS